MQRPVGVDLDQGLSVVALVPYPGPGLVAVILDGRHRQPILNLPTLLEPGHLQRRITDGQAGQDHPGPSGNGEVTSDGQDGRRKFASGREIEANGRTFRPFSRSGGCRNLKVVDRPPPEIADLGTCHVISHGPLLRVGVLSSFNFFAVDGVVRDPAVGSLTRQPTDDDTVAGTHDDFDLSWHLWNILFRRAHERSAADSVAHGREGQNLHGIIGELLKSGQEQSQLGSRLGCRLTIQRCQIVVYVLVKDPVATQCTVPAFRTGRLPRYLQAL